MCQNKTLPDLLLEFTPSKDIDSLTAKFREIAKAALDGGYFVINKGEYSIYLLDIEFYFHSELENGIHEPHMYHKNSGKTPNDKIPFFPKGTLCPNQSGIDVTFEDYEHETYRASFLIRGYKYVGKDGEVYINNANKDFNPRFLWDDLFGNASFLRTSGMCVEWKSKEYSTECRIRNSTRVRMPVYEGEKEARPWRFSICRLHEA